VPVIAGRRLSVGWDALLYNLITIGGDMRQMKMGRISPRGGAHVRDPAREHDVPKFAVQVRPYLKTKGKVLPSFM
jgi:hypothetical protein